MNEETSEKVESKASTQEFLQKLEAHAPDSLLRAFGSEFLLGVHTVDENMPVIVIPITSYEHAFAGMLEWEDSINGDFEPFFTAVPHETRDANGLLIKSRFTDLVIRNFDTRILKDREGNIRMLYAFPTRNVLIIAESPHTFVEALSRLRAERRI